MKRLTVLLAFGGESSEHDVSLSSAKNIYKAIDTSSYDVVLCYIDREGKWWLHETWSDYPDQNRTMQLLVEPGSPTVRTVQGGMNYTIDVLLPILHGKMGEDGTIQGMAAMMHVPIVGCDVEASALCMNKDATKRLVEAVDIPVVPWFAVAAGDDLKSVKKRAKLLHTTGPWFVKPSRAGSSVGVSRVTDVEDIESAIRQAFEHDTLVLVESAVIGRELEVAVLGNPGNHKASGVGEIIPGSDFYDYDDKYSSNSMSRTVLDARLPSALTKVIRQHALDAYAAMGCTGLARVDFLLSDELIPYLNEINTLPGFTDISMYPKLWNEKGVSQTQLISRLITLSLE